MKNIFSFIAGFLVVTLIAGAIYFYFDLGKYDKFPEVNEETAIPNTIENENSLSTENATGSESTLNHDNIIGTTSSSSVPQNNN